MRNAWKFTDPVTNDIYYMEINPKEDSGSNVIQKNTKYQASVSTYRDIFNNIRVDAVVAAGFGKSVENFSYSGVIYTKDQFDTLTEWFTKDYAWQIRDDLGREFLIYVDKFSTDRVRSVKHQWKHTYNFSGIIIEEI
mgnify:CR=1 FL=1